MYKSLGVLAAATVLLFTTACGASGGDDVKSGSTTSSVGSSSTTTTLVETTTTGSGSGGTAVEKWAKTFCGSFQEWITDIQTASDGLEGSIQPGDLPGAKAAIVGLFATVSDETKTLIGAIEDGGVPDIDDGDALVDDVLQRFEAFDEAITTAQADAKALPTDDPAVFQREIETLVTTFQDETQEVGESFEELDTKYPSPDLSAALSGSCDL